MIDDGRLAEFVNNRYRSYREGIGKKIVEGTTDLEELASYAEAKSDFPVESGRQEYLEEVVNNIMFSVYAK